MWDEKVPRKSNATSSGSRQIPGSRLVGFALAWVLGEPGWVIAALEDLDSLVVPNPTVAFALEQRVLNSFLDTLGATSALHVRRPTAPPRDHAVFTRRQLVRAKTQLRLEHPSVTKANRTFFFCESDTQAK